ncbi:hypothetical protein V1511DRAFT_493254 [Dipodascopsis uninucleata]
MAKPNTLVAPEESYGDSSDEDISRKGPNSTEESDKRIQRDDEPHATEGEDGSENENNTLDNSGKRSEVEDSYADDEGVKDGNEDDDNEDEDEDDEDDEDGDEDGDEDDEDDEDEDDDEDDEDDEDEDEEEEPRLKYTRIINLPPTLFSSDPLSCFLVHEKFLVFATHGGTLHITTPDFKPIRTYRAHSASILSLSTDGTVIASASLDGRVVIASVNDAKDISASDFLRPVHAVSLDPNFQSSRTFISGGTACSLIMSEKGWLGRQTDTTLFHGEGPIDGTDWTGDIIIAMNDAGIHLYHAPTRSRISRIALPKDAPRADLYRPRISWISPSKFLVGWAYTIWIIRVKVGDTKTLESTGGPALVDKKADVETILSIDGLVSGVLRYDDESLLILTYNPPPSPTEEVPRPLALTPELRLVSPLTGEEFSADQLSLRGYERLGANDYHLGLWCDKTTSARKFFVLSARDGVEATERNEYDRFEWLLERKRYDEAWEMSQSLVDDTRRRDIGIFWIESLVEQENWAEGAQVISKVLSSPITPVIPESDDEDSEGTKLLKGEWEKWAWVYVTGGHVADIAPYLPTVYPVLSSVVYEMVLGYYLTNDRDKLYDLLERWPAEIYDAKSIISLMENKLKETDDRKLRQNIAKLYVEIGEPQNAVTHLLHIKDPSAIKLIREQHLLSSLLSEIPNILTINLTEQELETAPLSTIRERSFEPVDLVVEGRLELLPNNVLSQVMKSGMEVMAFLYLERLKMSDSFAAQGFADLQVNLYADYDRPKLLEFLKKSNSYDLEKASEICEKREYIPELVYILGKTGENKKALMLIIDRLQDIEQAIMFAKSQDDKELWTDLLDYSMDKPDFIRALLEQAGTAIDPITLVRRIKEGLEIQGLKPALQRILHEYELTLSITQGATEIAHSEVRRYSGQLRQGRARAIKIDVEKLDQFESADTLIQYPCGHLFSEKGLLQKYNLAADDTEWTATDSYSSVQSVATKVTHLAVLRERLSGRACPNCIQEKKKKVF